MKRILVFAIFLFSQTLLFSQQWRAIDASTLRNNPFANRYKPAAFKIFQVNEFTFSSLASQSPLERTGRGKVISIPDADGNLQQFDVYEAPVMDPALSAKYPSIRSYSGSNATSTVRFSTGPDGIHAMILNADRSTVYIDPLDRSKNYYIVFSRKDLGDEPARFNCTTPEKIVRTTPPSTNRAADDGKLRTYRLALACTGEYAQYFLNGSETTDAQRKAKVLAAMNTLVTRTNSIYERDLGIRMVLIANNDALIYLNASTDPWTSEWNIKTQQTIDAVIGNANYDMGHLVHREASAANNNGNAGCIACVCQPWNGSTNPNTFVGKGGGFTSHVAPEGDPFVVDYTTHEMGHQFGANHTFTFRTETGTASQFEPGSGTTIMGYAGITGATDVQAHSDDYFHARSVEQISDYIKSTTGGSCAVTTVTGNTAPVANAGADFTIPKSTPFTLTGTASDVNSGDVLTYTWEQTNLGTASTTNPSATATSGPLFRSRTGSTNPSRSFPIIGSVLDGTNGSQWDKLPGVARTLTFRLLVRDNHAGGGNTKDDDMSVVIANSGPFAVTSPNTAVTWAGNSSQTVTWSVNNTTAAPVSCANVKISLSIDGGTTYSTLIASTPNDGTEAITIPNTPSTNARIKIEGVGNIFFDISNTNFTIGTGAGCGAVSGLTNTAITTTSATLNWSVVSSATSYSVDYKLNSSSAWVVATAATTALTFNLTGLTSSSLYDWRVRATCASGTGAYGFGQFTTQGATGGCATAFEVNETQATAATLALGTSISAAIGSATDVDFYKIVTTATGSLNIALSNLAGDYDLYLYNASGSLIGSSEAGGTTNESINLAGQAAGVYYIKAVGYQGASSTTICYNLIANFTPAATGCNSAYDGSTNGATGGAALIPLNTNVNGLISPSADLDYYKFTITTAGTATITLSTLPADYDLRLYSSNGTTQLAISENGGTTTETISRTFTVGTYYLRVYGYNNANNASTCYTLKVTTGTASRLNLADENAISVYPNPVLQTVNVRRIETSGTAIIKVYDANGRVVLNRSTSRQVTQLDIARWPKGVYLIKVNDSKKESSVKILKQ